MPKKELTIQTKQELDAHFIAMFVQKAGEYQGSIRVELDGKSINAKSIMGMLSLGLKDGDTLTIVTEGADEEEAISGMGKLFVAETL